MTIKEIQTYYDNFLPHLAHDHKGNNARIGKIKVSLGQIVKEGMTVLDLGCGTGITSYFMAQLGAKVTAVDLSPKLIEYAKKHSAHKNVTYKVCDVTKIHLKKSFDLIVMVDVLEHIPGDCVEQIIKVLNEHSHENTWMFLNIPDGRYQAMAQVHLKDRLQIVDGCRYITQILAMFHLAGFVVTDVDIYGIDCEFQYNTFTFIREDKMKKYHEAFANAIKK